MQVLLTFRDDALHADQGSEERRKQLAWRHFIQPQLALEANVYLLTLFEVLPIDALHKVVKSVIKGLKILPWLSDQAGGWRGAEGLMSLVYVRATFWLGLCRRIDNLR